MEARHLQELFEEEAVTEGNATTKGSTDAMDIQKARELIEEVDRRDARTDPDYLPNDATRERYLEAKGYLAHYEHTRPLPRALEATIKFFGCQNPAEIEKDQWLVCKNCVVCDAEEALAKYREVCGESDSAASVGEEQNG